MKIPLIQRFYRSITRHVGYQDAHDLAHALQRRAVNDSAEFIEAHALTAYALEDSDAVLDHAVKQALAVDGCLCEFGVFQGRTLRRIAALAGDRLLHGFDSFQGLPEDWRDGFRKGAFDTKVPVFSSPNINLHVGWFDVTLPGFVENLKDPIAFAHIDCDLYSSTKTVLSSITPYLIVGSVLLFDEYFNYPGWREHEHRALIELTGRKWLEVRPIAYNKKGQQLAVMVIGGSMVGTAFR